jgi:hypothetical protein
MQREYVVATNAVQLMYEMDSPFSRRLMKKEE